MPSTNRSPANLSNPWRLRRAVHPIPADRVGQNRTAWSLQEKQTRTLILDGAASSVRDPPDGGGQRGQTGAPVRSLQLIISSYQSDSSPGSG
jgi:hypothetical protein